MIYVASKPKIYWIDQPLPDTDIILQADSMATVIGVCAVATDSFSTGVLI